MGAIPSGEQWTIKSGDHEAVVVEVGGGLRAYRVAGVDVVDGYSEDELPPGGAGQVLAPWPNRIRDGRYVFEGASHQLALTEPSRHNALHGLVNWSRWRLVDAAADTITVEYEVPAQPGYPWPLLVRGTWTVGPDGLRATHEATNLGTQPCPFGFAAHPYLRVGLTPTDQLLLRVPGRSRLLTDGRLLPIGAARVAGGEYDFTSARQLGKAELDTAFGDLIREEDGGSAVQLSTVDGATVRIWADAAFSWWQVFTADTLGGERYRRSVAVEPMTCPPDAFRSGRDLVVLQPGESWRGTWGIAAG
jgi:aldose 1-epimerase